MERKLGKYYWFQNNQLFFSLYFDHRKLFHENPFILFMEVTAATKTLWLDVENYDPFLHAFKALKILRFFRPLYKIKIIETIINI